jgi:hypothetical protein
MFNNLVVLILKLQAATDPQYPNKWPFTPRIRNLQFLRENEKNNGKAAACQYQNKENILV